MIACENSGHSIPDDFPEVRKIVEAGVTTKPKKDYELSRYACYLIVQNGDPRKEVIALGQTYFAIQTYRQEVADHFNELDEDNRRLVVRGDIKPWNQMLAETAYNAGVIMNEEFAIFQNAGYMGLYGGLDVEGILAAVYQSVFGGDVYPSLEEKVANLLFNEIDRSRFERRSKMPYITIESGVLTDAQKEQLIKRLTEVSSEIMNVPQEFFAITIKELPDKNFGIGGKTIDKVKAEYMQTHK